MVSREALWLRTKDPCHWHNAVGPSALIVIISIGIRPPLSKNTKRHNKRPSSWHAPVRHNRSTTCLSAIHQLNPFPPASSVKHNKLPPLHCRHHCCSEPVKSTHSGCRLAYSPPADPDTLAPTVSELALRMSCSPSLLSIKTKVFCSNFLCGLVFISDIFWEWYSPHDWRRLSFIMLCHEF